MFAKFKENCSTDHSCIKVFESNVIPPLGATPQANKLQLEAGVVVVLKLGEVEVVIFTMALWRTGLLVVSVACVAVCGGDEAGSTTQQRARLLVSKQVQAVSVALFLCVGSILAVSHVPYSYPNVVPELLHHHMTF